MPSVMIIINSLGGLYHFRRELLQELLGDRYEVIILAPPHENSAYFEKLGCRLIKTKFDRRGKNPLKDLELLIAYIKIIRKFKPDVILTYTIKPNIYGGIAAAFNKVKTIHTVTGLGTVYIQDIWQKKLVILLNRFSFIFASKVFFLNTDNQEFYRKLKIISNRHSTIVVGGSGVNLAEFKYAEQFDSDKLVFTFIGRVLKDKGIEEFLFAAKEIVKNHENVVFQVVGSVEDEKYLKMLREFESNGIIVYMGRRNDIYRIITRSSCIVLPSYGEGRGTVLQEGAAVGRPLITCDTYGCKENVIDGYNGYLCKVADVNSLVEALLRFIGLSPQEKRLMGRNSRYKAEKEFDRKTVISNYLNEINTLVQSREL